MPQTKLGRLFDNIAIAFCTSIVFLAWIKKIIKNSYIALFLSIFLSFFLIKTIKYFQEKKLKKLNIKKEESINIVNCNHALRLMPYNMQVRFIKKLFHDKKLKQKNYILYCNKFCIINQINYDQTTPEKIYEAYQNTQNVNIENLESIIIIGNKITQEATITIKNIKSINIDFASPIETYALMKEKDIYPCELNKKTQKLKFKMEFSQIFMKKSAKTFLKCGLFLYISSLFVPYFKYYIITASILLILSVICFIFGKNEKINNNIIEKIKQS